MACKSGVAGSIPGFSINPLSVEPSGVPVILINTQIINPSGPVSTHGKATKSFFFECDCGISCIPSRRNSVLVSNSQDLGWKFGTSNMH